MESWPSLNLRWTLSILVSRTNCLLVALHELQHNITDSHMRVWLKNKTCLKFQLVASMLLERDTRDLLLHIVLTLRTKAAHVNRTGHSIPSLRMKYSEALGREWDWKSAANGPSSCCQMLNLDQGNKPNQDQLSGLGHQSLRTDCVRHKVDCVVF